MKNLFSFAWKMAAAIPTPGINLDNHRKYFLSLDDPLWDLPLFPPYAGLGYPRNLMDKLFQRYEEATCWILKVGWRDAEFRATSFRYNFEPEWAFDFSIDRIVQEIRRGGRLDIKSSQYGERELMFSCKNEIGKIPYAEFDDETLYMFKETPRDGAMLSGKKLKFHWEPTKEIYMRYTWDPKRGWFLSRIRPGGIYIDRHLCHEGESDLGKYCKIIYHFAWPGWDPDLD